MVDAVLWEKDFPQFLEDLNSLWGNGLMDLTEEGPALLEWGPALWRMLHYLAVRTGMPKPVQWPRLNRADEEKRIWNNLLTSLRTCLPCPRCKAHYNEYLRLHKLDIGLREPGLWAFHNHVRTTNEQPLDLSLEEARVLYRSMSRPDYDRARDVFLEHLRRGMFKRMYTRDDMTKCVRAFQELVVELEQEQ